jgi:streptogramin lyase
MDLSTRSFIEYSEPCRRVFPTTRGSLIRFVVLFLFAAMVVGLPGSAAAGKTTTANQSAITEFPLSPESLFPGGIVQGPDGNLWFIVNKGQPGKTIGEMTIRSVIDRITPAGQISEFALPPGTHTYSESPAGLTSGPDNSVWYLRYDRLGRMSMNGDVTELPITGPSDAGDLAAGPEGNLWYTSTERTNGQPLFYSLGKTTPNGETQKFPIGSDVGLWGITAGPDNAVWFTQTFTKKIGRITPDGQITQFSVPYSPSGDIVSVDGKLWFTSNGPGLVSLTTSGATDFIETDVFRSTLTAGGEGGDLWFVREPGVLGHLTSAGTLVDVKLPEDRNVSRLTNGPGGTIWYSAEGHPPCEGGGGTCQATTYDAPGVIGRIVPHKLPIEILGASRVASSGRLTVRVRCVGGNDEICHGRLMMKRDGDIVGQRRFAATVGKTGVLALRLKRSARLAIFRTGQLRVSAATQSVGGDRQGRRLTLRRR